MSRKTGIVADRRYMDHSAGYGHPESPQRLAAIYRMLEKPPLAGLCRAITPRPATREELAMIHHGRYIDAIAATEGKPFTPLDPDTSASEQSFFVASLAAGGVLQAIDSVLAGETDNAFALVRPPGHHAEAGMARGFCLFNNVAIGAMHAMHIHAMKKVLIADWDLHHGNGTQHSFYEDNRVLYFSTHQYPYYPGTGAVSEIGRGEGRGYTINVPLRAGADDARYVRIFRQILEPVALHFKPEIILVSAGFDTYEDDPLGGMELTVAGFASLTRILMDLADACCGGRLVMTLEGGYHLEGEAEGVKAVLLEMLDEGRSDGGGARERDIRDPLVRSVIDQLRPYWPGVWEGGGS